MSDISKKVLTSAESILPHTLPQNPAPVGQLGQQYVDTKQDLTDAILKTFYQVLPSNYVAEITGPYYNLQFQAVAESLADLQILAQQTHLDTQIDFTRPEYLWQTLGTLVFPDLKTEQGVPKLEGDVTYRAFLKEMLRLLLLGSTQEAQQQGVQALADDVQVVVRERTTTGPKGYANQHVFEVEAQGCATWTDASGNQVVGSLGTGFSQDPSQYATNAQIVLRALKPGHVMYQFRNVFLERFPQPQMEQTSQLQGFYYEDTRKMWGGRKAITGTAGVTLADRTLFSDPTRDFTALEVGSTLHILTGENASISSGGSDQFYDGRHLVQEVLTFPFPTEATSRAYTTSPTGLSGSATVTSGVVEDAAQDWSQAVEGEVLTFTEGPNAGSYRIQRLLGTGGGFLGWEGLGTGITQIAVAPSLLRLETRMGSEQTGQSYSVSLEYRGVKTPLSVVREDVSDQL